jgi:hypothetical protein
MRQARRRSSAYAAVSGCFDGGGNQDRGLGVSYPGTRRNAKTRSRFLFFLNPEPETVMVITTAHIPAIVALIAGILILLMPRLLNLVVAIYLIFIGLVGLGVLRALHL